MKQVKSENRNRMAGETLYHSLRLGTTNNILVLLRTTVSEKPQPQPSN